jgi:type VI secretion system protein ImpF
MAITSRWDKTLPCLLDRITGGEGPKDTFVSPQRYLSSVRRDIYWLLRTEVGRASQMLLDENSGKSLADFPNARSSVIAYGVPKSSGEQGLVSLETELLRLIEKAIETFEPRIVRGTLRVRRSVKAENDSQDSTASNFSFEIECDVRMKPLPEHLLLKAHYSPATTQWRMEGVALGS